MNDPAVLAQRALRDRLALALREGVIAAIDLGDTETKCVIARVDLGRLAAVGTGRDADEYSALRVIGTGTAPAAGATGGEVEAPARAAESIRLALDAAQAEAGVSVHSAIFCLGDGQPRTLTASTSTAIPAAEVDDATVARLMATCRPELALRLRRPILVEPGSFTVDGVTGIRDPRGKPARTLGMLMSVLTVEREALKAIMQAATLADLGVDGIVSSGIASAVTCLTNDELELGAVCIDMGSSITVHAGFREGRFQGAGVVPIGGERITADLAAALSLSMADAEALKVRAGGPVSADPSVLGGASGGSETSTVLVGVVRPRLEEIFEKIRLQLEGEKPRPVVLTGGASQLPGVIEVAKAVLGRRARLGRSVRVPGAPADAAGVRFSSALGALAYAIRCDRNPWAEAMENVDDSERRFNGIFDWLRRNW